MVCFNCLRPYCGVSLYKLEKGKEHICKNLKICKEARKLSTTLTSSVHTVPQESFPLSDIEDILLAESFAKNTPAPSTSSSPSTTTALADGKFCHSNTFSSLFKYVYFSSVDPLNLPSSPSSSTSSNSTYTFLAHKLSTINSISDANNDVQHGLSQHIPRDTPTVSHESTKVSIKSNPTSSNERAVI